MADSIKGVKKYGLGTISAVLGGVPGRTGLANMYVRPFFWHVFGGFPDCAGLIPFTKGVIRSSARTVRIPVCGHNTGRQRHY